MPPKKLTDSDKQDILSLYRQTGETTTTLASRYGVSNTTISRILKQTLSDDEYEALIQQKRLAGRGLAEPQESQEQEIEPIAEVALEPEPVIEEKPAERVVISAPTRRSRKRVTAIETPEPAPALEAQLPLIEFSAAMEDQSLDLQQDQPYLTEAAALETVLEPGLAADPEAEELLDGEEDFADLDEDDDDLDEDDDDLDDDAEDDDFAASAGEFASVHVQGGAQIQVLPLSEALIPKTFYLVVDRASELITRPLRDFADLGQIPEGEIQEKTLPIFDNHRVAKRFLRRMQRVVKVPDGRVLKKVSPYLQAKGITRLLIDGRVYSL